MTYHDSHRLFLSDLDTLTYPVGGLVGSISLWALAGPWTGAAWLAEPFWWGIGVFQMSQLPLSPSGDSSALSPSLGQHLQVAETTVVPSITASQASKVPSHAGCAVNMSTCRQREYTQRA